MSRPKFGVSLRQSDRMAREEAEEALQVQIDALAERVAKLEKALTNNST